MGWAQRFERGASAGRTRVRIVGQRKRGPLQEEGSSVAVRALPVLQAELRLQDLQEVPLARTSPAGRSDRRRCRRCCRPPRARRRLRPSTLSVAVRWPCTTSRRRAAGSSTRVRSKSMWGDTGVRSSARWVGATIGPARRERVGGRPGGGGHDEAVGGVGGEELAVDLHREPHRVPHRGLLEHGLVEGEVLRRDVRRPCSTAHREEHPLLDACARRRGTARWRPACRRGSMSVR